MNVESRDCGRAVSFLEVHKSNFLCSVVHQKGFYEQTFLPTYLIPDHLYSPLSILSQNNLYSHPYDTTLLIRPPPEPELAELFLGMGVFIGGMG